jgi:hypothetical protein
VQLAADVLQGAGLQPEIALVVTELLSVVTVAVVPIHCDGLHRASLASAFIMSSRISDQPYPNVVSTKASQPKREQL